MIFIFSCGLNECACILSFETKQVLKTKKTRLNHHDDSTPQLNSQTIINGSVSLQTTCPKITRDNWSNRSQHFKRKPRREFSPFAQ
jgi:hypothetical protein